MYMQSLTLTLCIHVCVCVCVYVHACMCVYVCDKWSAIRSKKLEVQALHFFLQITLYMQSNLPAVVMQAEKTWGEKRENVTTQIIWQKPQQQPKASNRNDKTTEKHTQKDHPNGVIQCTCSIRTNSVTLDCCHGNTPITPEPAKRDHLYFKATYQILSVSLSQFAQFQNLSVYMSTCLE